MPKFISLRSKYSENVDTISNWILNNYPDVYPVETVCTDTTIKIIYGYSVPLN